MQGKACKCTHTGSHLATARATHARWGEGGVMGGGGGGLHAAAVVQSRTVGPHTAPGTPQHSHLMLRRTRVAQRVHTGHKVCHGLPAAPARRLLLLPRRHARLRHRVHRVVLQHPTGPGAEAGVGGRHAQPQPRPHQRHVRVAALGRKVGPGGPRVGSRHGAPRVQVGPSGQQRGSHGRQACDAAGLYDVGGAWYGVPRIRG
jgi:hypothetical protein